MADKVCRVGFPKTGTYMSVVEAYCKTPADQRDRFYAGPVAGKPGFFNFCLFPMPVTATAEQTELLRTAEAVAKLAGNGDSQF